MKYLSAQQSAVVEVVENSCMEKLQGETGVNCTAQPVAAAMSKLCFLDYQAERWAQDKLRVNEAICLCRGVCVRGILRKYN